MAQFPLVWFNTAVIINPNAISQRALYRQKSVGGAFISTGFTPANDLPTTATNVTSPVLADNIVWEFKVQCICTVGGPTDNNNGIVEGIDFACIAPVFSSITSTTATATLNVTGLDITKARFVVKRLADDVIVSGPTIVNRVGNSITLNMTGLVAGTEYYLDVEYYATVNGVEVISSNVAYIGTVCVSASFETAEELCAPCTEIEATVIED